MNTYKTDGSEDEPNIVFNVEIVADITTYSKIMI
jgi:hypothetical protein